ncbi:MAG: hypothetical protein AAF790_01760 [Planctomycetota bacterium]
MPHANPQANPMQPDPKRDGDTDTRPSPAAADRLEQIGRRHDDLLTRIDELNDQILAALEGLGRSDAPPAADAAAA